MKNILILHNPTAGDAEHSKRHLIDLFKGTGMIATYVSSDDEGWEKCLRDDYDAIYLAGGDGTVQSLAVELLKEKKPKMRPPVHLLPLGTANNIAATLSIYEKDAFRAIDRKAKKRKFDCGKITGISGDRVFVEGVGMGVLPELNAQMEGKEDKPGETPEEKLDRTLKVLLKIVRKYKPKNATIELNGFTIKGSFLMVEVMNTRFVGPKLQLAPEADTGDGYLDLVMIPENKREELVEYIKSVLNNETSSKHRKLFYSIRVQKLKIKWKGTKVHVDDALDENYSGDKIKIKILPGAMAFLK
jgi:diacylglycerol kinase (ATP)